MVASTASGSPGFIPIDRPRIAVASDGTLAAIAEPSRIVVLEIPGGEPFAEIGIDGKALANDLAWVGAPPRLVVVSRFDTHSTAHLIDPYGPRTIAELRFEAPIQLQATVGIHALVVGAMGAAVLVAGETHLTPYQFPARGIPVTAGAAGANLVVGLTGSIEEWDPQSRMPRRRLRLPRPAVITALGGSDRVVWMTTRQEPSRIDVIALVNRGQPKHHELPEPIASVSSHPRSDVVVCLGQDSGRIYAIDLDGRTGMRVIGPERMDRPEAAALVVGRVMGVLAAQRDRPVALITLDGREIERTRSRPSGDVRTSSVTPAPLMHTDASSTLSGPPAEADVPEPPRPRSTLGLDDPDVPATAAGSVAPAAKPLAGVSSASAAANPTIMKPAPSIAAPGPASRSIATTTPAPATRAPSPPSSSVAVASIDPSIVAPRSPRPVVSAARLAPSSADAPAAGLPPSSAPVLGATSTTDLAALTVDRGVRAFDARPLDAAAPTWRDHVVTWAIAATRGTVGVDPPSAPPVEELAARLELPPRLVPAVVLLYGAHLGGKRGVAPVDVARVLGGRWDEALGHGELAESGLARFVDSRVQLTEVAQRTLDELPAMTGMIVGRVGPIALIGPCVVVAPEDEPLEVIATRYLGAVGGAILVADDDVDPALLFAEGRVRGVTPMLRVIRDELVGVGSDPAILVVDDDAYADELAVPRLS